MTSESAHPAVATPIADEWAGKAGSRRTRLLRALAGEFRALPIAVALVLLGLFFATQSDVFLTSRNISNLLVQSVVTGTVSLGIVFVLLLGEIDLSVAATSGVCAVLMSRLVVDNGWAPWLAIVLAVALGALIGAVSARWSTVFRVPTFVVTLGLGLVLNGVQRRILPESGRYSLLDTGVEKIAGTSLSPTLGWIALAIGTAGYGYTLLSTHRARATAGNATSLKRVLLSLGTIAVLGAIFTIVLNNDEGVPVPVLILFGLVGIAGYITTETRFGLRLYAVGGNADAAARVGIKVNRVKIASFAIAGALAAFAGVIAASRILGVSVSSGGGIGGGQLLLESIAAAVIGGVSLFGGRGQVSAALLGAVVLGVVSNGLNLMGVADEVKLMVTGALLILAVSVDQMVDRASSDSSDRR